MGQKRPYGKNRDNNIYYNYNNLYNNLEGI